jgi:hypothetical protein
MAVKRKKTKCASEAKEIQRAKDYGIDLTMLMDNLKRSPAERIRRHQIALDTIEKLRRAKRL